MKIKQDELEIVNIGVDDIRYQEERELRNKILLRPFGLKDGAWEMSDEISEHVIALYHGVVIGCLLLCPIDKKEIKLMQMAIDEKFQGNGVGGLLMKFVKKSTNNKSYTRIFCHAREIAFEFYIKQDFKFSSELFEEVGINHRKMEYLIIKK